MNKKISLLLLMFCSACLSGPLLHAQERQITGQITAIDSGEPLVGVVLRDTISGRAATTDGAGFYALSLPSEHACLLLQYLGYADLLACGDFGTAERRDFSMVRLEQIAAVEVRAARGGWGMEQLQGGVVEIPVSVLREMPQLGGEADLFKTLALMPGMSLGVEGSSGLFIRGGTPDQNLVLVDGAPVYNLSHFGPFLSVFNMDAVESVRVSKGTWPAEHGGRLSGLVDIHTRDGNMKAWAGQAAASPLLGRLMLEGPLWRDKTSVLLSVRSSWLGGLMQLAADDRTRLRYLMYDLNAKLTHRFNDRHRLYLSVFNSMDNSRFVENSSALGSGSASPVESGRNEIGICWGNQTASAGYHGRLGERWSLQGTLYYTQYRYTGYQHDMAVLRDGTTEESSQSNTSANRDVGAKLLLSRHADWVRLDAGVEQVSQSFAPQSGFSIDTDTASFSSRTKAWQQAYFAGAELWPDAALSASIGFRQVLFHTGSTVYASPEPRLSLRWRATPALTVKAGGSWGSQFLHLLTTGNVGLTSEVWVGSTAGVPPQRGGQASGGAAWRYDPWGLEVEAEVFARHMTGVVDFKPIKSEDLFTLSEWEELVETGGLGQVQGLEVLVRRRTGRLSGWVAYTLSRNTRRFEHINGGEWYPFRFDRRHDFSVVGQYQINSRWRMSATWVYQTGVAITLPTANIPYGVDGGVLNPWGGIPTTDIIAKRNNARMPAYHRMDLSLVRRWAGKREGQGHTLGFSIYNAYSRINPYFIRVNTYPIFGPNGQYLGSSPPEVTVVGLYPIIPAVSYAFEFGGKGKDTTK